MTATAKHERLLLIDTLRQINRVTRYRRALSIGHHRITLSEGEVTKLLNILQREANEHAIRQ